MRIFLGILKELSFEKTMVSILNVVLGTAGHIDHGKSSLIKVLTGTDPDRLKEEKERGLTTDIGYASLRIGKDKVVGWIDVPGHEKFIKNMVAGATGIDLVVIVVAADDGVMPQTREHVEILELLGVNKGVVAITKIDLAEEELIELVEAEIRDFLVNTVFREAPIFRVSTLTGEGMEQFRAFLEEWVLKVEARAPEGSFRMPVQRVFSAKGFGTVVTGVPLSGKIRVGDPLEILPQGIKGRVRGLQAYQIKTDEGRAGHRLAINMAEINYRLVKRGDVVLSPGLFKKTTFVEGRFQCLAGAGKPLKNRSEVRFHTGTYDGPGRVVVLDGREVRPGGSGLVQVSLSNPVVVAPGDRFILRTLSPTITLGGGMVLGESKRRYKSQKPRIIENMLRKEQGLQDPLVYLEAVLESFLGTPVSAKNLVPEAHATEDWIAKNLMKLEEMGRCFSFRKNTRFIHSKWFEEQKKHFLEILDALHRERPLLEWILRRDLKNRLRMDPDLFEALCDLLEREGMAECLGRDKIHAAGHRVALSPSQQKVKEALEEIFLGSGINTPSREQVLSRMGPEAEEAATVLEHLLETGILIELGEGILMHQKVLKKAEEDLRSTLKKKDSITPSQCRELFSSTRKYIIPLLEFFDQTGVTERRESKRFLKGS